MFVGVFVVGHIWFWKLVRNIHGIVRSDGKQQTTLEKYVLPQPKPWNLLIPVIGIGFHLWVGFAILPSHCSCVYDIKYELGLVAYAAGGQRSETASLSSLGVSRQRDLNIWECSCGRFEPTNSAGGSPPSAPHNAQRRNKEATHNESTKYEELVIKGMRNRHVSDTLILFQPTLSPWTQT